MRVPERQFRKIIGYRDLATLVIAIERHAPPHRPEGGQPSAEPRARYPLTAQPRIAAEVPRRPGHPRALGELGQFHCGVAELLYR
jgi:hypothetical protein